MQSDNPMDDPSSFGITQPDEARSITSTLHLNL